MNSTIQAFVRGYLFTIIRIPKIRSGYKQHWISNFLKGVSHSKYRYTHTYTYILYKYIYIIYMPCIYMYICIYIHCIYSYIYIWWWPWLTHLTNIKDLILFASWYACVYVCIYKFTYTYMHVFNVYICICMCVLYRHYTYTLCVCLFPIQSPANAPRKAMKACPGPWAPVPIRSPGRSSRTPGLTGSALALWPFEKGTSGWKINLSLSLLPFL